MMSFLVALALYAHGAFWGLGVAIFAMPRRWRAFWPMLVFPAGWALQSAVVWSAAWLRLPGANEYAWWSLALPAAVLALAVRRRGVGQLWREAARFGGVWAVSFGALLLFVAVLVSGGIGLTTVSLGSCDAADYAAGARTLMEFSRGDRVGFLGLVEVVRVHSVDNFYDYWLRLNHFTPAALLALNGAVLDCPPHELATVFTMFLLAGSVPVAFWVARAVIGLRTGTALMAAGAYGLTPVGWYAVAHVAPGQLLAATAIGLLTWSGIAQWRALVVTRGASLWTCTALAVVAYWIVLGSYTFILAVALVPAVAYVVGAAIWRREWGRLTRWAFAMLVPLAMAAAFGFERVAGLAERVSLLREYDFGWEVPVLSPEGWLGVLAEPAQLTGAAAGWRWGVGVALVFATGWALRGRGSMAWRAACVTIPALCGYAYLAWRGEQLGTNASYDAYKLLAVFFPGVLATALVWLEMRRGAGLAQMLLRSAGVVAVGVALAWSVASFSRALTASPLRVTRELRELAKIETMAEVASLNLLIPDMWSRLWANAFLLRKPQYFATHTYEARLNTPLRGEWNLQSTLLFVSEPDRGVVRRLNASYVLVQRRSPTQLAVDFGSGWHAEEAAPGSSERWRWAEPRASFVVENPFRFPVRVRWVMNLSGIDERAVSLRGPRTETAPAQIGPARADVAFAAMELPPGRSDVELFSRAPAARVSGDTRALSVRAWSVELQVLW